MHEQFFFIGTEAELIKVFPLIIEFQKRGQICNIIASGQNDLKKSRILDFVKLNGRYIELSLESDIKKSKSGLFTWFFSTLFKANRIIEKTFSKEELVKANLLVHGDTISTFMGALIGNHYGMRVCHVEAGLRSHNLFNPFPEEIDRLLTSKFARVHFAPGKEPSYNLKKAKVKGKVINTRYNTILDSLRISKSMPVVTECLNSIVQEDYFVFVMHRQENIINTEFFKTVIDKVVNISKNKKCVLILHKITENKLVDIGRLDSLKKDKNFILLPRVDYFDFMKLLDNAKFIITDGGSNQEELHYMGKPCLIMRKTTERKEGLGQNAILYGDDVNIIEDFAENYEEYKIEPVDGKHSPSRGIAKLLARS